jgi:hypothetical protein
MRAAVLAGRFLLELCLLGALAAGGWALADRGVRGGALAVIAASSGAAAWGVWIAPRSHRRLTDPRRFVVEIALFVLGAASLWVAWAPAAGVVFGMASTVVAALTRLVGEPSPTITG